MSFQLLDSAISQSESEALSSFKEFNLLLIVPLKNLLRLAYLIPKQLREDVEFRTCSIPCSRLLDMFEQLSRLARIELRGIKKLNYKLNDHLQN